MPGIGMIGRGPYHVRRSQLRAGTAIRGSLPLMFLAVLCGSQRRAVDFPWEATLTPGGTSVVATNAGGGA
jgi:hypothetical protein